MCTKWKGEEHLVHLAVSLTEKLQEKVNIRELYLNQQKRERTTSLLEKHTISHQEFFVS